MQYIGILSFAIAILVAFACFMLVARFVWGFFNGMGAFLAFATALTGQAWLYARYADLPWQYSRAIEQVKGVVPVSYLIFTAAFYGFCLLIRWVDRRNRVTVEVHP